MCPVLRCTQQSRKAKSPPFSARLAWPAEHGRNAGPFEHAFCALWAPPTACLPPSLQDLNRQLIKSNNGVVHIPHIGFEIPKRTQQGVFTTLEGVLMKAAEDLEITLPLYKAQAPEEAVKLEAFMEKLKALVTPEAMPYTVILDDPSGNSFMENPQAPTPDPHLTATYYTRNVEQNHALGLYAENASAGMGDSTAATAGMGDLDDKAAGPPERTEWSIHTGVLSGSQAVSHNTDRATVTHKDARFSRHGALITQATGHAAATVAGREGAAGPASASASYSSSGELQGLIFDSSRESNLKEVMAFPVSCHACAAPGETRMCVTDVPHFREIIIMAFSCEQCGHRDVEVKAGGAIPEKGTVHTLKLTPGEDMAVDLRRDCIKSDSASVEIPELEFEMEHGSLGGMYTTVEGLLGSIEERLRASNRFVLEAGDSAKGAVVPGSAAATEGTAAASPAADDPAGFLAWFDKFLQCKEGAIPFTLIMRDPLSSSYIWSPFDDEETGEKGHDPRLSMEEYTRSAEDDLLLGITDMKTEGYEAPAPAPAPLPVVAEADGDGEEAEATEG